MPRFVYFLYLLPLALGAMISLKTFRLSWPRPYQLFSLFLIGTLIMELFAISWKLWLHYTSWWHYSKSNLWIYNLYYIPQYLFYFLFYYRALEKRTIKQNKVLVISLLYLAGSIINVTVIQGSNQLNTYTIVGGNLGVLFFALHYFKQELQRKPPTRVVQDPLFWISTGAFIFHTVSLPYFVYINYLSRTNLPLAIALFNIILILNIFMHSLYLIAFLCKKPSPKKRT
jgi:hypothetical protein